MTAAAVWTLTYPCGRKVWVAERACSKAPIWCEACARAYSEPCHHCDPCELCQSRRRPARVSRCLIVRLDPELNHEIEAMQLAAKLRGKNVPLAVVARDLLWRGLNEARRWRHRVGQREPEDTAQGKLFE